MMNYKEMITKCNPKLRIIGVTGSYGKTTTLKIIQEYLKRIGKKSILFASCGIDIENRNYNKDNEVEIPLYNKKAVDFAINTAINNHVDYLLLEINEITLDKGYVKDVPFNIRAITNIIATQNLYEYSTDEYIRIKESFFKDLKEEDDTICIFGNIKKKYLNDLMVLNNKLNKLEKRLASTRYLAELRKQKESDIDYLLYTNDNHIDDNHIDNQTDNYFDSINGLSFNIKTKNKDYSIKSNMLFPHNALNILLALSIIDSLGELDINEFNKLISDITILGRDEVIRIKGRTIIVSNTCASHLEYLKKYQERNEINKIRLVTGSLGYGFYSWGEAYKSDKFSEYVNSSMKYIYKYINNFVDKVYITSNDNALSNPQELIDNQIKELNEEIEYYSNIDRKEAIRQAVIESNDKDVILITGRGNREIFCKSEKEVLFFKDIDIVKEAIKLIK